MKVEKNGSNGITLIALVITIIVLLILAGVSIATLTGNNGLLTKVQQAKEENEKASDRDLIAMAVSEAQIGENGYQELDETNFKQALENQFKGRQVELIANGDRTFNVNLDNGNVMYYLDSDNQIIDEEDMIAIGTAEELKTFRDDVNSGNSYEGKYVYLTSNITLDINEEWEPIGLYPNNTTGPDDEINNRYFKGIFDGNNYEINNLYINNSNKGQGLFGLTKNATIKNIVLGTKNSINGGADTAGIVAYCYCSKIYNCENKSAIIGNGNYTGGIVGFAYKNSIIENCNNKGNISNDAYYSVGGIVGYQQSDCRIINCINSGIITGYNHVGGINGSSSDSSISKSANVGDVIAKNNIAGGIIGISSHYFSLESCYNMGNIKSISWASGILAYQQSNPNTVIRNCYTVGNIEADYNAVAICGAQTGITLNISNCYYLKNTINGTNDVQIKEGLVAKDDEELKLLFTELGEDFKKDVNNINNGYPILVWQ